MASRPRTLPAAIAPVLVGSAAAHYEITGFRWGAFLAALVGSIFIQIGTNLANDYSDAKRGADAADRLGPVRVTSSGLVAPRRTVAVGRATSARVSVGSVATVPAGSDGHAPRAAASTRGRSSPRQSMIAWNIGLPR